MSEHITHIAIYEDTARLVAHSDEFGKPFKDSLRDAPDAGLVASGSRGNHVFAIPIITQVRKDWKKSREPTKYKELLAASIGWLSHRAMDLQVKPNYLKQDGLQDPRFSTYEQQIYYDAITFEKVYGGGAYPSISPLVKLSKAVLEYRMENHPAAALVHVGHLEPLMVGMVQQQLLSMRRFNGESASLNEWLDAYSDEYQKLSENLEVYIEAFVDPDPVKINRYVEETNFYNEEDEIIRLVRQIQRKGTANATSPINLENALERAKSQSHYAQGLARSYDFIRSANKYFLEEIARNEVYDQVQIFNKSHRI